MVAGMREAPRMKIFMGGSFVVSFQSEDRSGEKLLDR
jgi:hypothetical protein